LSAQNTGAGTHTSHDGRHDSIELGCPRIFYTDVDRSWLLAEWHEVNPSCDLLTSMGLFLQGALHNKGGLHNKGRGCTTRLNICLRMMMHITTTDPIRPKSDLGIPRLLFHQHVKPVGTGAGD
jgi:hypothetical protein